MLKLYVEENNCYCPLLTNHLLVNPTAASAIEQDFECETLGINKQEFAIKVYPNPAKNVANLQIYINVHYKIISTLG